MNPTEKSINHKKLRLRKIKIEDYDQIIAIQLKCFPGMKPWSIEQLTSLVSIFPEGQICLQYGKSIIASSCSLILNIDDYDESASWNELTDQGMITNHNKYGDTLYGMEIMVDPDYRGMKLSRRLYDARKDIAKRFNLEKIVIGGRLPNYHKHAKKMGIDKYVEKVIDKVIYDPVLTAQLSNGFFLKKVLPDYLPNDKESLGYATLLEWTNFGYKTKEERRNAEGQYVRVSAIQYQMRSIKNFEEFEKYCEFFVDTASDYRSDFVVFPEMITLQLLSFLPYKKPADAMRELHKYTPHYENLFSKLAIKYNVNIIAGSHFAVENDNLYNISYLFRRDGTHEKQYKIHITPHEKKWWGVKSGNKINVFNTDKGKVAILICYDSEFPELARIATSKGAKIIFVPFNTDDRRGYLRVRYCSQARAVENQVYVVITGCVGNLPDVENLDVHFSQAAIFTPSDVEFHREAIASEATPNTETLIYQDLDLNLLKRNREMGSVQTWNDRKQGFYKITYVEDDVKYEI
ncbi:MAG: bifunctional GNAT family N-acetyltransferase/carbon-nitrogen hydrolase family protein [Sphingobacteriaceae bacterium]|nr:bifunctional GNAT family N-acetyltransferase/carbon-nitrogen hydrolase family protein [Sphingobacteriaceae bacterium]